MLRYNGQLYRAKVCWLPYGLESHARQCRANKTKASRRSYWRWQLVFDVFIRQWRLFIRRRRPQRRLISLIIRFCLIGHRIREQRERHERHRTKLTRAYSTGFTYFVSCLQYEICFGGKYLSHTIGFVSNQYLDSWSISIRFFVSFKSSHEI